MDKHNHGAIKEMRMRFTDLWDVFGKSDFSPWPKNITMQEKQELLFTGAARGPGFQAWEGSGAFFRLPRVKTKASLQIFMKPPLPEPLIYLLSYVYMGWA